MIDPAFTLEKKTAIVVGAANGIGRATALAFAAAGARVGCADVEEPGAKATAAEIEAGGGRALPVHLDVTDSASCKNAVAAAVQRFGGLDVLMYGAADSDRAATVLELDEADFRDRTQNGTHLMGRIRRLFNRAELDGNEVNILRGILTAVQNRRRRAGEGQ